MLRLFAAALLVPLLLAAPGPLSAQSPAAPSETAAPAADRDAARQLARILEDDAARSALVRQLLALAEAGPEAGAPPAAALAEDAPIPSPARQVAALTRDWAEAAAASVVALWGALRDVGGILTGTTPVNGEELRALAWALAFVAVVTLGLHALLRLVAGFGLRRLAARAEGGGVILRVVLLAVALAVDALLVLLAWAGGYGVALAGTAGAIDIRQSLFLNAFLLVELSKVVLRGGLVPALTPLRLAPMADATAGHWYFWSSRLVGLLGYGLLLAVPLVEAAVSPAVGRSLAVLVGLMALALAVSVILRNRLPVRAALYARHRRYPDDLLGMVEARLGLVWHWLAIVYLAGLFAVWTADPGGAPRFVLGATLQSALAVVAGFVAMLGLRRALAAGVRLPEPARQTLPLLEPRLNALVPGLLQVVRVLIVVAVVAAILQAWWIIDVWGWLASDFGQELVGRLAAAAFMVLLAVAVWLAVSSLVEYRLNPDVGTVPTVRTRTLLSLFRNAFTVALAVVTVMVVLSELGMNIGPLLAGAGVLGLAIGFGAQKLVQDIITGAFIQIENAMNEGEVVTAGGITGVVEHLTIRSVGLRDLHGTYHLIPFSSVGSVSNFMKGFGFHVAEVGVAYREDVSEVKALMQTAFDELHAGPLAEAILEPLDMQGVTRLGDSAVVVRARIKCRAGMQWAVGRAYTEIVKRVLDAAGVEIPFPHMTVYMGQDKDGSAPPLHLAGASLPAPPAPQAPAQAPAKPPRRRRKATRHEGAESRPDIPDADDVK